VSLHSFIHLILEQVAQGCPHLRARQLVPDLVQDVTGLRATHQLGATHKLCVTHILSINRISVGDLTANEYALDWVPLC
jgi:hypothetical protein